MEKNDKYFLIGFILSLTLYISLLWFILSYIAKSDIKSKQFTSKKDSFIEISVQEKKAPKKRHKVMKKRKTQKKAPQKIKKEKKVEEKKKRKIKQKIKKSSKRTTKSKSLKSLFNSINTKKYIKKEQNLTKKANQNSRIPKKGKGVVTENKIVNKSASSIVKSLSLDVSSSLKSQKSGEYNEYIGKISDMLDQKWQETTATLPGNVAKVTIKIDKFGNFSYKIDELSYNNEFNAKLESFLESLKDEKFPPYKMGEYIILKVNFKDE